MRVIAVDPGTNHTGLAVWKGVSGEEQGTVWTREIRGDETIKWVDNELRKGDVRLLVLEDFVLYDRKRGPQSWQPMLVSETIGGLKVVAGQSEVEWVMQPAYIKKPTAGQLRGRGIARIGKGPHERDAELHLWHALLKRRYAIL